MKDYHRLRIAGNEESAEVELPKQVALAIDDLAGKMREGLLALSVGARSTHAGGSRLPTQPTELEHRHFNSNPRPGELFTRNPSPDAVNFFEPDEQQPDGLPEGTARRVRHELAVVKGEFVYKDERTEQSYSPQATDDQSSRRSA